MTILANRTVIRLTTCLLALLSSQTQAEFVGIDLGPGPSPTNWTSVSASGVYQNLRNDVGEATSIRLEIQNAGTPFEVTPSVSSIPVHRSDLGGIDGTQYQFDGTFTVAVILIAHILDR